MVVPSGTRNADEPASRAGSSVPCHPDLENLYDPEEVLARLHIPDGIRPPLSEHYPWAYSEMAFDASSRGRYHLALRFTTEAVGYVLTRNDVVNAVYGDVDHVLRGSGRRGHYRIIRISLPRPSATTEEREEAARRFELWRRDEERREQARAAAEARQQEAEKLAWKTLLRFLTSTQRYEIATFGYFTVVGSEGTIYRIRTNGNVTGNVSWYDDARDTCWRGVLCAHCAVVKDCESPSRYACVPRADHYLTQLLELSTDELHWLRLAELVEGLWPPAYHAWLNEGKPTRGLPTR